jgi:hypothetical protein
MQHEQQAAAAAEPSPEQEQDVPAAAAEPSPEQDPAPAAEEPTPEQQPAHASKKTRMRGQPLTPEKFLPRVKVVLLRATTKMEKELGHSRTTKGARFSWLLIGLGTGHAGGRKKVKEIETV